MVDGSGGGGGTDLYTTTATKDRLISRGQRHSLSFCKSFHKSNQERQELKGKIAQVFNYVCGTSLWNRRPVDPKGKEEPSSGFEAENASTTGA